MPPYAWVCARRARSWLLKNKQKDMSAKGEIESEAHIVHSSTAGAPSDMAQDMGFIEAINRGATPV